MDSTDSPRDLTFTLNGAAFTARIDASSSLMQVLREQAGLISPKNGCAPQGSCGCCTVLVDGRALASCAVPARTVEGKSVVTLEGLDPRERHIFAHAFAVTGGLQCGFCTPGIVVRAKHLLDHNPRPTRAEASDVANSFAKQFILYRLAANQAILTAADQRVLAQLSQLTAVARAGEEGQNLTESHNKLQSLYATETGGFEVSQEAKPRDCRARAKKRSSPNCVFVCRHLLSFFATKT